MQDLGATVQKKFEVSGCFFVCLSMHKKLPVAGSLHENENKMWKQ